MNGPEEMETKQAGSADARFEQELARALRRVDAPEALFARIMERAEKGDPALAGHVPGRAAYTPGRGSSRLLAMPRRQWMSWASGAMAAMLVAGVFVGQRVHEQRERRVQAERQFETATRITDQALDHVREQLAQQGIQINGQ